MQCMLLNRFAESCKMVTVTSFKQLSQRSESCIEHLQKRWWQFLDFIIFVSAIRQALAKSLVAYYQKCEYVLLKVE